MFTTRLPFYKNLTGRLLTALTFVAVISVIGLGLAAYHDERAALETQVVAQLTSVADLKKEQITTWLAERQADVRLLAVNKLNQDHFTQILSPQASARWKAELTAFLTDNFIGLQRSRPGYSEIAFVDTEGIIIVNTDPALVGRPTAHEAIFRETLAAPDGVFIEDIHLDPHTGRAEMAFGQVMHAVNLDTGQTLPEVIGLVYIIVNMDETIYPLLRVWPGMGETGETLLVRAEDDNILFLNNLRFNEEAALRLRLPANSPQVSSADLSTGGSEGIIQTLDYRSVPVLAAYRHIPEIDWGFIAQEDLDEAFAPVNALAGRIGILAVVVLLLASLISLAFSRSLTQPLGQLLQATRAVAAGNLSTEIKVVREDEVGQLAHAFNEMARAIRKREIELQHLTASLEQRVEARTADLQAANEKLQQEIAERKRVEAEVIQARDQALEASRLKTQLLANVSHELRTPLNAILGYTEMLQTGVYGPLSGQQSQATTEIIDSTGQLLNFVNNLLDQAQIEAGKVVLHCASFSPAELLDDLHTMLGVLAQVKGLSLTSDIGPDVPPQLSGDPYWLRQILVNLVNNAIKFTEQGSIHIHIYRHAADRWGLQVSDTGRGIPAEAQVHIFEAFWQVDGTATRGHKGSGLGLSIVKQLTLLMGGQMMLESEVGQGSTFTIVLPLEPAPQTTIS